MSTTASKHAGRVSVPARGNGAPNTPTPHDRRLLNALRAFRSGDFTVRLPMKGSGVEAEIAQAFNECMEMKQHLLKEVKRVSTLVGRDGRVSQRGSLENAAGAWQEHIDTYNSLIDELTAPMAETNRVLGAVAQGDLSQRMALDIDGRPLRGEFLRSARVINAMVDQLNAFASEVTRVAREVGSEGKLGGQASVKGVAGTWKDLTDSVNTMAGNLTN
jgi:methyl-accepting chemotaxis protein